MLECEINFSFLKICLIEKKRHECLGETLLLRALVKVHEISLDILFKDGIIAK